MSDSSSAPAAAPAAPRPTEVDAIQFALRAPIPHFYANGFGTAQTPVDLTLIWFMNGNPACTVNITYTTAKSLIMELEGVIKNIETAAGQSVKTISDISDSLQKVMQPNAR